MKVIRQREITPGLTITEEVSVKCEDGPVLKAIKKAIKHLKGSKDENN